LPKWIGINGIINKLDDTVTTLQQIADNSDSAFTNADWTNTEPPKFVQRLKDIYTGYKDKTLTNPNPANSLKNGVQKLIPVYINNLGEYTVTNTSLNIIYQDFDTRISVSIDMIDQAKDSAGQIKEKIESIKQVIEDVKNELKKLDDPIKQINDTIIDPAYQIVKNNLII
jgi:uncharacterized coiled-coil DUF342 family protein